MNFYFQTMGSYKPRYKRLDRFSGKGAGEMVDRNAKILPRDFHFRLNTGGIIGKFGVLSNFLFLVNLK